MKGLASLPPQSRMKIVKTASMIFRHKRTSKSREKAGAVSVHVAAPGLIVPAPEMVSLSRKRISAENRRWLFAPIGTTSIFRNRTFRIVIFFRWDCRHKKFREDRSPSLKKYPFHGDSPARGESDSHGMARPTDLSHARPLNIVSRPATTWAKLAITLIPIRGAL